MIERTLTGVAGIEKAVVTLTTSGGHVEFDPALLGPRDIIKIVEVRTVMKGGREEEAACLYILNLWVFAGDSEKWYTDEA